MANLAVSDEDTDAENEQATNDDLDNRRRPWSVHILAADPGDDAELNEDVRPAV